MKLKKVASVRLLKFEYRDGNPLYVAVEDLAYLKIGNLDPATTEVGLKSGACFVVQNKFDGVMDGLHRFYDVNVTSFPRD